MQPSTFIKSAARLCIGLSLLLIPVLYSCNNGEPAKTEPEKADSVKPVAAVPDSTVKKDTLKKDTIPAKKDTSKGGQDVPITQTRPPKGK